MESKGTEPEPLRRACRGSHLTSCGQRQHGPRLLAVAAMDGVHSSLPVLFVTHCRPEGPGLSILLANTEYLAHVLGTRGLQEQGSCLLVSLPRPPDFPGNGK